MLFLNKPKHLLLALLVGSSLFAQAQAPKQTIIDFGKGGKTTTEKADKTPTDSKSASDYEQNLIHIDFASALAGFVSFGYERALTDKITAELSGGITFFANNDEKLSEIMAGIIGRTEPNRAEYWTARGFNLTNAITTNENMADDRKAALGAYGAVAAKYFFENDAFDGFYIAPRLQYINYNFKTAKPFEGTLDEQVTPLSTSNVVAYKNYTDAIAAVGWQNLSGNIVFSYELGVGARFVSINDYDTGYKGLPNRKILYEVRNYNDNYVLPMVSSLFKIGIIF